MGKIKKVIYNKELKTIFTLVHLESREKEAQAIYVADSKITTHDNLKVYYMEKYAGITKFHARNLKMINYVVIDTESTNETKTVFNSMFDYEVSKFLNTYEPEPKCSETQRADESSDELEGSRV